MSHGRTSCRGKGDTLVRGELERLYAQRSVINAVIRELELRQISLSSASEAPQPNSGLEFSSKPCNLTSCRSA